MHPLVPLLQLISVLSRVEGRKKLQKTVHILKELGAPFRQRFEYSLYGMYSPQLRGEVECLERDGLIAESPEKSGTNPSYVVEPQPSLLALLKTLELDSPPDWAATAKHLNTLSPSILEGISTLLFLRRMGTAPAQLRSRLLELKPHLTKHADKCFAEFRKLKPVSQG